MNEKSPTPSTVDDPVVNILEIIEQATGDSKFLARMGIHDEIAQEIHRLISNPSTFITRWQSQFKELFTTMFISTFAFAIQKLGLTNQIHALGYNIENSKINLWIILKKEYWNFSTREHFYQLLSTFLNSDTFNTLDVDLLVLREGNVAIPQTFQNITL